MKNFFCALITVLIEGGFFCCFSDFRNVRFLCWCGAVNFMTNTYLNLILEVIMRPGDTLFSPKVVAGEILVVFTEYFFYGMVQKQKKMKLFLLTFAANLISFSCSFL